MKRWATRRGASAIYLILEFSQPYLGLFRIPPEGAVGRQAPRNSGV